MDEIISAGVIRGKQMKIPDINGLKKCPFCGATPEVEFEMIPPDPKYPDQYDVGYHVCRIKCLNCIGTIVIKSSPYANKNHAWINAYLRWNTRV